MATRHLSLLNTTDKTYGPYSSPDLFKSRFPLLFNISDQISDQKKITFLPYMPISTEENHRSRHCLIRRQRKLLLFFLKCTIMLAVISLFLFFLGFAAVVLLHFLFVPNTLNRRCNRLHNNAAVETLPQILPDVVYSEAVFPELSDCAICLDSFEEGDISRYLPVCKHLFHARCVDRWIQKKPTCPVCRTRVDLNPTGLPGSRIRGDDHWKRLWNVNFEEGTSY